MSHRDRGHTSPVASILTCRLKIDILIQELFWGHIRRKAGEMLHAHLCHRGLSKSVKSSTCRSSDASPAGPIPPCSVVPLQIKRGHPFHSYAQHSQMQAPQKHSSREGNLCSLTFLYSISQIMRTRQWSTDKSHKTRVIWAETCPSDGFF